MDKRAPLNAAVGAGDPGLTLGRTAALAGIATLGGLLLSYNTVVISGTITPVSNYFGLTPLQMAITASAVLWGTLLGTVAVGVLPHVEPRSALKWPALLFIASAVGSAGAWGWLALAGFRFVGGVAIGFSSVIIPAYLVDISPPGLRGRIVGAFQFNIGVGVLLAYLVTYFAEKLTQNDRVAWRVEFGFAILPASIFFLLLWLVNDENRSLPFETSAHTQEPTSLRLPLFRRVNLRPILLAAGLAIFNQVTGINVVLYYLNDILGGAAGGRTHANLLAALLGFLNLCLSIVGIWLVDKIGRKPLLVAGAAAMAVCMFRIGTLVGHPQGVSALFWWLLAFNAAFGLSQGPVIWVFLSEIFPKEVRLKGLSWGSSVLWAANGAVTFLFALAPGRKGATAFLVFGGLTAVQCLVVLLFYPETKG